jgi:shikimate dehydrogenase
MTPKPGRRAAVLGHPIAHSLSPTLHRAAYQALGLDTWSYDAFDVDQTSLPGFLAGLDGSWAGLSLTMPLKSAILPLLDHVEPLAGVVGAVNTVLIQGSGARRVLVGANTDVYGIVAALREGGVTQVATAVVLGAGATAGSALAALSQLGCTSPEVLVRSIGRTGALRRAAHRMGVDPGFGLLATAVSRMPKADVVISTLPSHGADGVAAELRGGLDLGTAPIGVLLDAAYKPRPTALGSTWARAGGRVVAGEVMLLHQGAEQVRLMTGLAPPVEAMRAALQASLQPADE